MADSRATIVEQFRQEQGADSVYILTALQPFGVSQNRCMVMISGRCAQLVCCNSCTPRTSLGQGSLREVEPAELEQFLRDLQDAELAWTGDAIPPQVHDGITYTVERADAHGYERVRIVDPSPDSPHVRLLAAWRNAFPEARRMLDSVR
ncbi:MAG: hypothetical protein Kow00106_18690 [Anaerolineae bacterium]